MLAIRPVENLLPLLARVGPAADKVRHPDLHQFV